MELVDASTFGVGLAAAGFLTKRLDLKLPVYLGLTVPGLQHAIVVQGEIRRIQEIPKTQGVRLGVQFSAWPDAEELKRRLEPFAEFLHRFQRDRSMRGVA